MRTTRRNFLLAGAGGAALAGAGAWRWWPEHGVANPCSTGLPAALARHEIVAAAWEGIDPAQVWDCHAHIAGIGDGDTGAWINPRMNSPRYPLEYAQRLFYLNAGCTDTANGRVDASYVERMQHLVRELRPGCKLMLMAFEHAHDASGAATPQESSFHIPNDYPRRVAQAHPAIFEWIASIHPLRKDAVAALELAHRQGARAIKWLPAAMNIDPASPGCDAFYGKLARLGMPLISHGGMERAVHVGDRQKLGNPLRLRRALDHGVRVIVAHCSTMGDDQDIDKGPDGPYVTSFELFARLMDEPRYENVLGGDVSAVTQINRAGPAVKRILERTEWHARLVNGSDYPLPGIMPLFSVSHMVENGFITRPVADVLAAIRPYNPLLFDFVLKRHMARNGRRFAAGVFHTRPFFTRVAQA